jgi:hypothetical protein
MKQSKAASVGGATPLLPVSAAWPHSLADADGRARRTGGSLRRRVQFAPEPARRFAGFHRVDKLHHLLMDVSASWALECPDIKARVTGGNPRQHGSFLACGATWLEDDHNARPWLRREHNTLSHR